MRFFCDDATDDHPPSSGAHCEMRRSANAEPVEDSDGPLHLRMSSLKACNSCSNKARRQSLRRTERCLFETTELLLDGVGHFATHNSQGKHPAMLEYLVVFALCFCACEPV